VAPINLVRRPRDGRGLGGDDRAVLAQRRETLPNGRSYDILQKTVNGPSDNTMAFRIPPAGFFVLGDNRSDSLGSRQRNGLGYVPQANLTGVMYTVYWSKDFSRPFLRIR
jgi:signal peptidase I